MSNLALCDCDSFYCSCERLFRSDLTHRPVVVAGNNDGCVVSRSKEAKPIIPTGAPIHEYRRQLQEYGVVVFSSNYALYQEVSSRVQSVMSRYTGKQEIFSIDESFLDLSAIPPGERAAAMSELRGAILHEVGIPVSIGLAPTKVLSKLASHVAKSLPEGVHGFADAAAADDILSITPCDEIWYVGPARSRQLREEMGITSGLQLKRADIIRIRRRLHVPVARIVCELRGIPALPLHTSAPARKEIMCARAFGKLVTTLADLQEAVARYTADATRRLLAGHQVCGTLSVSLMTNGFRTDLPQYRASCIVPFDRPTNYIPDLITAARAAAAQIFKPGISYYRAGVMLSDLDSDTLIQGSLFADDPDDKQRRLLAVIAAIEAKFGKGAIYFAATGGSSPPWAMRQNQLSPRYLTRWSDLPVARA
jgi:DNA polymerase V